MPHYSHLVARMIWRQVIGRTSILGGGGGLVWCEPEYHPFLQIILVLNLWCGKELNQFPPPTSSDDLSPLFCLILLLCREHCVYSVSGPGRYLAWKSLCTAHTTVQCAHRVRWGGTNESTSSAKLSKLPLYRYTGGITKDWDPSLKHPDLILSCNFFQDVCQLKNNPDLRLLKYSFSSLNIIYCKNTVQYISLLNVHIKFLIFYLALSFKDSFSTK